MNGITQSNASAVAQQLTDATTTSCEDGAGSHRLTGLLDGLGISSAAHDPRVTDRSAEGYAASAATGFGTGALFSLGSRGLGNAAIGKPATPLTPAGDLTNRVIAPEIPAKNAVATGTIDHAMGGVASVANEWLRPGGKRGLEDLPETLGTGVLSGAHGPTVGVHRAP